MYALSHAKHPGGVKGHGALRSLNIVSFHPYKLAENLWVTGVK